MRHLDSPSRDLQNPEKELSFSSSSLQCDHDIWPLASCLSTLLFRSTVDDSWWFNGYPPPHNFIFQDFGGVLMLKLSKLNSQNDVTRWHDMIHVAATCHSELWFSGSWNVESTWHLLLLDRATCHCWRRLPPFLSDMVCHDLPPGSSGPDSSLIQWIRLFLNFAYRELEKLGASFLWPFSQWKKYRLPRVPLRSTVNILLWFFNLTSLHRSWSTVHINPRSNGPDQFRISHIVSSRGYSTSFLWISRSVKLWNAVFDALWSFSMCPLW